MRILCFKLFVNFQIQLYNPCGFILEKMCPSAKPFWAHIENLEVVFGALVFSLGPKGFGT